MITSIKVTGTIDIGDYFIYDQSQVHQPINFVQTQNTTPINIHHGSQLSDSYHIADLADLPNKVDESKPLLSTVIQVNYIYLYVLYEGFDYIGSGVPHEAYYGDLDFYSGYESIVYKDPFITIGDTDYFSNYKYVLICSYDAKKHYYQNGEKYSSLELPVPPNYIDLLSGYYLDNRTPVHYPIITSSTNKSIELGYYRENKLEQVPKLRSIDWINYRCELIANIPYTLPISDCVLGTLVISDNDIKSLIISLPTVSGKYDYANYFDSSLPALFTYWNNLYSTALTAQLQPPNTSQFTANIQTFYYTQSEDSNRILRTLGANNDHWNNRPIPTADLNIDPNHPMIIVDNQRSYDWHIKPVVGGIGELNMDSPRVIEIHTALQAQQYLIEDGDQFHTLDWYIKAGTDKLITIWKALGKDEFITNTINPDNPKIPNLGYLIKNIARVLGIRVNDEGKIDRAKERSLYQPLTLQNPNYGDSNNNYSLTCWGDKGRVSPYLPNTYKDGRAVELFDVYSDIPQMLDAFMRQLDVSLSIQHGSEIRIRGVDGKVQAYPNQLAVSLECLNRLERIGLSTQKSLISTLITSAEVRELYSGIGIPVSNKYLPLYDPNTGRTVQLPYFGHQKNKPSVFGELATIKINLAVQTGMLAPKKSNGIFNPFAR